MCLDASCRWHAELLTHRFLLHDVGKEDVTARPTMALLLEQLKKQLAQGMGSRDLPRDNGM